MTSQGLSLVQKHAISHALKLDFLFGYLRAPRHVLRDRSGVQPHEQLNHSRDCLYALVILDEVADGTVGVVDENLIVLNEEKANTSDR